MRSAIAIVLLGTALGCGDAVAPTRSGSLSVGELLGPSASAGFARAIAPRDFRFPADHGPHPSFRTEWWYYTGSLASTAGDRYGYQLTFFRSALAPEAIERTSAWGAHHVFMAHFALTDVTAGSFASHERFARQALGLAGASAEPFRVLLEGWSAMGDPDGGMRLHAHDGETGIDLRLAPGKGPVLQGDRGLSRKGSGEGNASYYYSLTRLPTSGTLTVDGTTLEVSGTSWMDREWSTSVLETGQVGWDWFALQLDDGRDLMVYQIRRSGGSADPNSSGVLVAAHGDYRTLTSSDFEIEVQERWTSPASGASYPAEWELRLAQEALTLSVRPLVADQELRHTFRYWEGAVEVSGTSAGEPVSGRGYVELTGYD